MIDIAHVTDYTFDEARGICSKSPGHQSHLAGKEALSLTLDLQRYRIDSGKNTAIGMESTAEFTDLHDGWRLEPSFDLLDGLSSPEQQFKVDGSNLSPVSQSKLQLLLRNIEQGKVKFVDDESGDKPSVQYKEDYVYRDQTQSGKMVLPKTDEHCHTQIESCLKLIRFLKKECPPAGVFLDTIKPRHKGRYNKHEDYSDVFVGKTAGKDISMETGDMPQILGQGISGKVVVVRDNESGREMAQKEVMIAHFNENEIRAWTDLHGSETFPKLYCLKIEDGNIKMFCEYLTKNVSLTDLADEYLGDISRKCDLTDVSVYLTHGLLKAVKEMHDKGWTHNDMHGGNAVIQHTDSGDIKVRVLDFGLSQKIVSEEEGLRAYPAYKLSQERRKEDVLNVVRQYFALRFGYTFESTIDMKLKHRETFEKSCETLDYLSKKDFQEFKHALDFVHNEVTPSIEEVLQYFEKKLPDSQTRQSMLSDLQVILFGQSSGDFVDVHSGNVSTGKDMSDLSVRMSGVRIEKQTSKDEADGSCSEYDVIKSRDDVIAFFRNKMQ